MAENIIEEIIRKIKKRISKYPNVDIEIYLRFETKERKSEEWQSFKKEYHIFPEKQYVESSSAKSPTYFETAVITIDGGIVKAYSGLYRNPDYVRKDIII